jgi:hypothetical protein
MVMYCVCSLDPEDCTINDNGNGNEDANQACLCYSYSTSIITDIVTLISIDI